MCSPSFPNSQTLDPNPGQNPIGKIQGRALFNPFPNATNPNVLDSPLSQATCPSTVKPHNDEEHERVEHEKADPVPPNAPGSVLELSVWYLVMLIGVWGPLVRVQCQGRVPVGSGGLRVHGILTGSNMRTHALHSQSPVGRIRAFRQSLDEDHNLLQKLIVQHTWMSCARGQSHPIRPARE